MECTHNPRCPQVDATDSITAKIVSDRPEQGWSLLCNGLVVFYDGVAVRPDRSQLTLR